MINPQKKQDVFKILLVGDVGTGKTTFLTQLIHRIPERLPKPTTYLSVFTMRRSKPSVVVQVWDSPGDNKYYYQILGIISNFNAVLLFVDVTNEYTFERARLISDQIAHLSNCSSRQVHVIESKIQVVEKDPMKRKVSHKMLWQLADKFNGGLFQYRQNQNIEQVMQNILEWSINGKQLLKRQKQKEEVQFQQIKFEKQIENLNCQCAIF